MSTEDNAKLVELALRKAINKRQNFEQYASIIDSLAEDYITDPGIKQKFLMELAESIESHK